VVTCPCQLHGPALSGADHVIQPLRQQRHEAHHITIITTMITITITTIIIIATSIIIIPTDARVSSLVLVSYTDLPSRLPTTSSNLYANNAMKFVLSAGPTTTKNKGTTRGVT
jgi:hypothetical protein